MTNILRFTATNQHGWEAQIKPYPASQNIPSWWKEATPYVVSPSNPDGKKFIMKDGNSNTTFKKCVPMLDALTLGYIIPLWASVQVSHYPPDYYELTWRIKNADVFLAHGDTSEKVQPPAGYSTVVFKYINTWIPKTPPGYSVLITAPLGHRDLPFHAIPAVIDSDKSTLQILPPMWVKTGFEGVVERGTPMLQVIPFRREDWKAEYDYLKDGEYQKIEDKNFGSTLIGHYIKKHWSKKTFK